MESPTLSTPPDPRPGARPLTDYAITLLGGSADTLRINARTLAELLLAITEGAAAACRLHVDGVSRRKGPRPAWLNAAAEIELTALEHGSVALSLEAPNLPRTLGEGTLVETVAEPSHTENPTALDLLWESLEIASNRDPAQIDLDRGMVEACLRIAEFVRPPYTSLRVTSRSGARQVEITPATLERMRSLAESTPTERVLRIAGRLTTISADRPRQELVTRDGLHVTLHTDGVDASRLRELWNRHVVVEGQATFRPTGRIGVLRADSIEPMSEADEVFTAPPVLDIAPLFEDLAQSPETGIAALFGTWPGDESDDDLLALLRAMR